MAGDGSLLMKDKMRTQKKPASGRKEKTAKVLDPPATVDAISVTLFLPLEAGITALANGSPHPLRTQLVAMRVACSSLETGGILNDGTSRYRSCGHIKDCGGLHLACQNNGQNNHNWYLGGIVGLSCDADTVLLCLVLSTRARRVATMVWPLFW